MTRILVTGSSDGLGLLAARQLVEAGHAVVLHGRNPARAAHALAQVPGAAGALHADLSSLAEVKALAQQANDSGPFDAIIHNAAVGFAEPRRITTPDGLAQVFAVNTLAPYVLTALIKPPKRLVYVSSQLHLRGDASLHDLNWEQRRWDGMQAYADSKLHMVLLAFAIARRWPDVLSNCVEPGWVPTRMGGPGAPGDLKLGARTQAWLGAGTAPSTRVTGDYFHHHRSAEVLPAAFGPALQEQLLARCADLSGVALPLR
ncbi:MAG: Diacetyl reductase [(S)-acetoin forming] [Stenotrophomonas maltophilia]|uniref:Diacetyl reductase [(S)-acetoin forming] n=1 Tax=Stenotrophomonas maltophilia TaxID=40324 RepID=A0A7V8FDN1_STEMA|nr:MAG: Diacetyl reductase [(S)-acetoin forming] [Stenotrophomonas maltophilia]